MLIIKRNAICCLLAIGFAVLVYGVMILVTGTITLEEIGRLPKGDKLVRLIKKVLKK